ncbi:MAG TPA: type IX secretion system outer membrane channel protein PorV [Bacteroidia bacterium]|nr:type IX secretion system outer membrane channel protein PorV [Bacteroidia bacterium]
MKTKAIKAFTGAGLLAVAALNAQTPPTAAELTEILNSINTITTAVPFLMITPDSRAGGMGETGVASTPDGNSIHWNGAKLAFIDKEMGFGISYTPWLRALVPDINLAYLSWYMKPKRGTQAFGASMRYFSLGNITFTDQVGNAIGQFRPNEFAFDFCYANRLSKRFSASMAARIVRSNLTNGITVAGQDTKPGTSFAVDLSTYYYNDDIKVSDKKAIFMSGLAITNIGSKMSYSSSPERDFIPINLRLGSGLQIQADEFNKVGFQLELSKLLVPSPPIYELDSNGSPKVDPATGKNVIKHGKDPDRSVPSGMLGSFGDAPGGFKEEMREFNVAAGVEYWYNDLFAVRAGYFYEHPTKGNRQFITLGAGIKYNVFGLDFAYLIPTNNQRSPLQNTLRFSLLFDIDAFKSQGEGDK